jgi:hypothetical protein
MNASGPLFLGDLHAGSHHAPWPLERLPQQPQYLESRYLVACLDHALQSAPKRIGMLILTGDLVDGRNPKGQGCGLFSPKLSDQVEASIELTRKFAERADVTLRVSGTDYHDDIHNPLLALDLELRVAKVRQVFNLRMPNGHILNVAHHPKGGGVMYEGTKLDQEQRLMRLAADVGKVPKARWIVRAHLHTFRVFRTPTSEVVLLPCWKRPDAHAMKGNLFGWQPDIGFVLMDRDDAASSGYTFRETLYDNPPQEVLDAESFENVA